MMWGNGNAMGGGAWILMGTGVLLLLLLGIGVGVLLVRRTGAGQPAAALDILDAGLARGDVTEDEYRSRRALITGDNHVAP